MEDHRIALPYGALLPLSAKEHIQIKEEIGRGASCLVYNAVYQDSIGIPHTIRLKECYPVSLAVSRNSEGDLTVEKEEEERGEEGKEKRKEKEEARLEQAKERFLKTYERNVALRNTLGLINSTSNPTDLLFFHNTVYLRVAMEEGEDYRSYQDRSLKELFLHTKSLTELIGKYHRNGYLHLDIKPENIFLLPETEEHVVLFDVDSVIRIEDLAGKKELWLPYSEGFCAPEQVQGNREKIGMHTDIYAIGALVFEKLFGRTPGETEGRLASHYCFESMRYAEEPYSPGLYRALEHFFRKTLSIAAASRWQSVEPVLAQLDELIRLSDLEEIYLLDSFSYHSACFAGRERELAQIDEVLANSQLVFLSGIGGIGKTELAKQYAQSRRRQYRTVVFAVFEKSIEQLVCDEIGFHQLNREETESDREYFQRKLELLKQLAAPDDLIILDNMDQELDENLEELFCCPCKFLITTRKDFRDYNYEQISVGQLDDLQEMLEIFMAYNDLPYTEEEEKAIVELIELVERHTMTVELIAKYLRNVGQSPIRLYKDFLKKEGITNTGEIEVRQRKDRRLRLESVNRHLQVLFDCSSFDEGERELMGSLSLLGGIRIRRDRLEELCGMEGVRARLDSLIKNGWIELWEASGKVSLHQVIQDLVYAELQPDAGNCPHIVAGMSAYLSADLANEAERTVRKRVFAGFMDRLSGWTLPYARLCLRDGRAEKLEEAEQICIQAGTAEAFDLLQRIYRKKIRQIGECEDILESGLELEEYSRRCFHAIEGLLEKAVLFCGKAFEGALQEGSREALKEEAEPSRKLDWMVREWIAIGREVDSVLAGNMLWYFEEREPELDRIYESIIELFDQAAERLPFTSYSASEKERLYRRIQEFYKEDDFTALYRCEYFSDAEKAYGYQEKIRQLRREAETMGGVSEAAQTVQTVEEVQELETIQIGGVSFVDLAERCRKEGRYEEAITFYQRGYEEEYEPYDQTVQRIAHVYLEQGEAALAISWLERLFEEEELCSAYLCIDLIQILIQQGEREKAKQYARRLITDKRASCVLDGYYFLYLLEEKETERESLWQECLRSYKRLGDQEIDQNCLDFILTYVEREPVTGEELSGLLDRLEEWNGNRGKERLIETFLEKNLPKTESVEEDNMPAKKRTRKSTDFSCFIILLCKLAELYAEYPDGDLHSAQESCNRAQEWYDRYGLEDSYLQSLIYRTRADLLLKDEECGYEQLRAVKAKCDFWLLAERELQEGSYGKEQQVELWREAAGQYRYLDCYEKEAACLNKALAVIRPIFGQEEWNGLDGCYWDMMQEAVWVSARSAEQEAKQPSGGNAEQEVAERLLEEWYGRTRDYLAEKAAEARKAEDLKDSEDGWNQAQRRKWMEKVSQIADSLMEVSRKPEAIGIYLAALYIGLETDPEVERVFPKGIFQSGCSSNSNHLFLWEKAWLLLEQGIETDLVDVVIRWKERMAGCRDVCGSEEEEKRCIALLERIEEKYQHQEVEFKHRF